MRHAAAVDVSLNSSDGSLQASVESRYESQDSDGLCAKLSQYPIGTRFWITVFEQNRITAAARRAMETTAAEHAFILDFAPTS